MAHDVFISYAKEDKPAADAVCARLESRGIRCWYAPRDVPPGRSWAEALVDAIAASRVFVLVYTAHANSSPQVIREVERAVHHRLALLSLRLEDTPFSKALEFFVSTPHWLEAMTPPLERHLDALADAVEHILATDRAGTPLPPHAVPAPRPIPRRRFGPAHAAIALVLAGGAAWALFGRGGRDGEPREIVKRDVSSSDPHPPAASVPEPEKSQAQLEAEAARADWGGGRPDSRRLTARLRRGPVREALARLPRGCGAGRRTVPVG